MKMVITAIQGNTAVGLRDDGSFVRLHQCGYTVGQTVEIGRKAPIIRFAGAIAAALMLMSTATVAAVRLPYSYVTLDINPSVIYTLNIFNRVLTVSAVNEDAKAIVDAIEDDSIAYATLNDAIEMTIAQCEAEGYIGKSEEDYVVLSVTSHSQGKTESLSRQLDEFEYREGHISAKIVSTTIPRLREAEQMGTTPGKLTIIGEMQEKTGDTQTPDHWINVPVREIIRETECGKLGKGSTGDSKKDPEPYGENTKASEDTGSAAAKAGNGTKSGKGTNSNTGQSKKESETKSSDKGQGSADGKTKPLENVSEQSPEGEVNANRGDQSGEPSNGIFLPARDNIEQAIAALGETDRELLSSYIEAYKTAVAAEEAAIENTQKAKELSSYRDAVTQALAALCEAAEENGTPLNITVQDGSAEGWQDDVKQRKQDASGSSSTESPSVRQSVQG